MAPRRKKQKRRNFADISNARTNPNNCEIPSQGSVPIREAAAAASRNFIDTLPDELLGDIFKNCVISKAPPTHDQARIPLSYQCGFVFSRVSSRWRRIALAETALWPRFRMKFDQGKNLNRATKALRTIIERTGIRELVIAIDGAHEDTTIASVSFTSFIDLLLDCMNRLTALDIHLPGECHVRYFLKHLTAIGTPVLARLSVSFKFNHSVNHLHGCNCSTLKDKGQIMLDTSNAPMLEYLAVRGFDFRFRESKLKLANLTTLHWRAKESMSIQRIVDILCMAPSMRDLRLYCSDPIAGNAALQTMPQRRVYHDQLKKIYLGYWDSSHLAMFFRAIEAPSLESLALQRIHTFTTEPPLNWMFNTIFVGYSSPPMLKTLVVSDSHIMQGSLLEILQEQRCLRQLSLQPYRPNDEFIKFVSVKNATGREFAHFPELEMLDISVDMSNYCIETMRAVTLPHHEQFIEMVLSRFQEQRGTTSLHGRLREVNWAQNLEGFTLSDRIDRQLRRRLKDAEDKGLQFVVVPSIYGVAWWTAEALE